MPGKGVALAAVVSVVLWGTVLALVMRTCG